MKPQMNQNNQGSQGNQPKQGETHHLPAWRSISKEQVLLTGGSLLATGAADMAMHFDKTGVFLGLLATGVVAGMSNDILDHLVPGRDSARVIAATQRVLKVTPPIQEEHKDQSAGAKLRRLVGFKARGIEDPEEDLPYEDEDDESEDAEELNPMEMLQPKITQQRTANGLESKTAPVTTYIGSDHRLILDLAHNFLPDVNMILAEGIFACGVKGSGKTGVLARIIEQIVRIAQKYDPAGIGIPLVIFDKEGDLESLLAFLPNGRIADPNHWYSAQEIITQRLQVVVNLQAWLKSDDAGQIMATLANDLIEYTSSLNHAERVPCPVFLDEAQYWLPQEAASYLSRDTQRKLLDAFSILLNTGRKRGLTPFIFTQRIAQIDKSVISMGIQIFMRQVIDNDLKRCMEYIRSEIISDKKNLAQLSEGQGIVCLPKGVQLAVQFKERESTHISHSPTVDRILAQPARQRQQENPMAYLSLSEQQPTLQVPSQRSSVVPETRKRSSTTLPALLREALNAYQPGMSYRDLAAAMGYSDGEAREIWLELRRRGLLHSSGQDTISSTATQARPQLYELPRPTKEAQTEYQKERQIDPADLAKAFVLWQGGASSVRKLNTAAKEAGYGWSNGMCRDLITAMEKHGLIQKREANVL